MAIESFPWTPKEDAVLRKYWPKKNVTIADVIQMLAAPRTEGGVKWRASKLGLGGKAREQVIKPKAPVTEPSPDNVRFEDHPGADQVGRKVFIPVRHGRRTFHVKQERGR